MRWRRTCAVLGALAVASAGLVTSAQADQADTTQANRKEPARAGEGRERHPGHGRPGGGSGSYDGELDVLFVGAHPDDESGELSTYGQWRQRDDIATGVVTITRGEGGGNAVGPEEGSELGLIREAEERTAVGKAGITDVHNLDEVDFFYTVSEPLTRQVWGHRDTLAKVVRVIRETRPSVIVTMAPDPSPGNHGNHQEAGRLATEAYRAAGDPERFAGQDVDPWQPKRLFVTGAAGSDAAPTGPRCEAGFDGPDDTADVYGVFSGREADNGDTWAQVEQEARREYASQGWAGFPDAPSDPRKLECDWFTQVASTVPYPLPGTERAARPDAMLQGAAVVAPGGFPLDTRFQLTADRFDVHPGESFEVTAEVAGRATANADVDLEAPDGWDVSQQGEREFRVTPPADAELDQRVRLTATLRAVADDRPTADGDAPAGSDERRDAQPRPAGTMTGTTSEVVRVAAPVRAMPELLPQVEQYEQWAADLGMPELGGRVSPVTSLPSGGSTDLTVTLRNQGQQARSGEVELDLPEGFEADETTVPYDAIPAGETAEVGFTISNTDAGLPTSNEGGDYPYTLTVRSSGAPEPDAGTAGPSITRGGLELVPTTRIPRADAAPTVDGTMGDGEYAGEELDLSRVWEGDACEGADDCAATGRATWHDDALFVVVRVTDDTLGATVEPTDCKRHWRTDSVEIALDPGLTGGSGPGEAPRKPSENTATTFKAAIFPMTTEGEPCYARDADNHQGPGEETAPGMTVASTVNEPYDGYTVEARIDLADLPASVDPERLGMNMFVYDSDTDDLTGQTRIGWSTWQGVQGDPYRWGVATLPGYEAPADRPDEPVEPVVPSDVAESVRSPQTIMQAAATGIPLAGGAAAPPSDTGRLVGPVRLDDGEARGRVLATGPGTAYVFTWSDGILDRTTLEFDGAGTRRFSLDAERGGTVAVGFAAEQGGTAASARAVR